MNIPLTITINGVAYKAINFNGLLGKPALGQVTITEVQANPFASYVAHQWLAMWIDENHVMRFGCLNTDGTVSPCLAPH